MPARSARQTYRFGLGQPADPISAAKEGGRAMRWRVLWECAVAPGVPRRSFAAALVVGAIITGSGKNIAKAIAETLARDGAAVVVNGRGDRAIIEETAKQIRAAGGRALPFLADVSKPDAVAAMVDAAVKEFGGVDIAVGN